MSVWCDNKKEAFPLLSTCLHYAPLMLGGMESNKESQGEELESSGSINKIIFFRSWDLFRDIKKLGTVDPNFTNVR